MSFLSLQRLASRLMEERRPVRFLISRVLWRTGLCRLITYPMPGDYVLKFHPSALSAMLWQDPFFRNHDIVMINSILRPGDTYLDVGANVGQLALVAGKAVGPTGHVTAIEAHPRTFGFLRENVLLNQFDWIDVLNTAIGEGEGQVFLTDLLSDDQNFISAQSDPASSLKVAMTTLDAVAPAGTIRLLKVDVEGGEIQVLRGGRAVLSRCDMLYIEESARNLARCGHTPEELRQALRAAGFGIFSVNGDHLTANPAFLTADLSHDLLAVRDEYVEEVRAAMAQKSAQR